MIIKHRNKRNKIIKSISYSQDEILSWIIKLYCPNGFSLDPTYSKGIFYKYNIKQPKYRFDINPLFGFVKKSDCRKMKFKNSSLQSIIFDPPFLATTGKSLKSNNDNENIIAKRFGVYKNMKELWEFYKDSLVEFKRILIDNGFLIIKIQDSISSGKQYLSHHFITQEAIKLNLYPKDLFILLAKNRIIADWQRNQKHARKFHSYFLVFQKLKVNIHYDI